MWERILCCEGRSKREWHLRCRNQSRKLFLREVQCPLLKSNSSH
uniref:Uncharacterized protein n=1 Tax=Parascaris equorum TaxID=6256 RepID=A0A914RCK4_PAREQ